MSLFRPPPVVRLRIGPPGGEAPRPHPRHPHPPSVVALVRSLVEGTTLPHRVIAARAGVDKGTVSRWQSAHGWQRPPGASRPHPRPDRRYVPVLVGRALAQRLRIQAERLVSEIEGAAIVDPAALAEALRLLAQAREEQAVRRTRRLMPPAPAPSAPADAGAADEPAPSSPRRRDPDPLPSAHRTGAGPVEKVWTWDRRAAALRAWKRRYARTERKKTGRPEPFDD